MPCQWDAEKARSNLKKHGVAFADAALALEDEFALTVSDPIQRDEERYITLGVDPGGRLLVVVFTWRGENIRIISARVATKRERRDYEDG